MAGRVYHSVYTHTHTRCYQQSSFVETCNNFHWPLPGSKSHIHTHKPPAFGLCLSLSLALSDCGRPIDTPLLSGGSLAGGSTTAVLQPRSGFCEWTTNRWRLPTALFGSSHVWGQAMLLISHQSGEVSAGHMTCLFWSEGIRHQSAGPLVLCLQTDQWSSLPVQYIIMCIDQLEISVQTPGASFFHLY